MKSHQESWGLEHLLCKKRQREVGLFSLVRRRLQGDVRAACQLPSRLLSKQSQAPHGGAWLGDETVERKEVETRYKEKFLNHDDSETLGQVDQGDCAWSTLGGFQCWTG